MQIHTPNRSGNPLIPVWNLARSRVLEELGPLSIRIATSEDGFAVDIGGSYGEEAVLAPMDLDIMQKIVDIVDTRAQNKAFDCLTVSDGYIIATATQNAIEFDLAIHRRRDVLGDFREVGDSFSLAKASQTTFMAMSQSDFELFDRDPVTVSVHDEETADHVRLSYAGSFDVDLAGMTSTLRLEEALEFEEDEEDGRLVCDIHESTDGMRSITITRDAMTPDGPTRRIVYSGLHA